MLAEGGFGVGGVWVGVEFLGGVAGVAECEVCAWLKGGDAGGVAAEVEEVVFAEGGAEDAVMFFGVESDDFAAAVTDAELDPGVDGSAAAGLGEVSAEFVEWHPGIVVIDLALERVPLEPVPQSVGAAFEVSVWDAVARLDAKRLPVVLLHCAV